jgi:hypothetical protein
MQPWASDRRPCSSGEIKMTGSVRFKASSASVRSVQPGTMQNELDELTTSALISGLNFRRFSSDLMSLDIVVNVDGVRRHAQFVEMILGGRGRSVLVFQVGSKTGDANSYVVAEWGEGKEEWAFHQALYTVQFPLSRSSIKCILGVAPYLQE